MTILDQHCPDEERHPVWGVILDPKKDHHHAMRKLMLASWEMYEPHAEKNFLRGIQGREFSQRWWEMYLWNRLVERGVRVSHPGAGMPDAQVDWRKQTIYFECVSPTIGEGDNKIPEFESGKAHSVPQDAVTLRMTTVIAAKKEQAEKRSERIGRSHYVIAVDTSQIRFSGFDEEFCIRTVYPMGHQVITFSRDSMEPVYSHYQFRPEIEREGKEPVPTSLFLNNKEYKAISAILFCNANFGNIAWGDRPEFIIVHNHHARTPLSTKLFPDSHQYLWNGEDALVRHGPPDKFEPTLDDVYSNE